jgi:dolichol-phosphate mannosyltransferase
MKLSVIVPVFNEATNILDNLELLISEVEPHFPDYEILVVSDGSTDGTNSVLERYKHPFVRAILFDENHGKGHTVREGFKAAVGERILFIDGGMELHPKEIRIFFGLMSLYNADLVIGSKRHPQSKIEYPLVRRILSFTYQMLIKKLFGLKVTDTQVGIKLFRREVIQAILPDLMIDRYGFDLEILALAKKKGFEQMLEAPVRMDYFSKNIRPFGREIFHIIQVGMAILKDTIRLYVRLHRLETAVKAEPEKAPLPRQPGS